MKKSISLAILFMPFIVSANDVDGYRELKFGMEYSAVKSILEDLCISINEDGGNLSGKRCYEIAGEKRNLNAYFYKNSNTLAQVEFDFIKDDMIFAADVAVGTTVAEGLASKYNLDKEITQGNETILSFNNSSIVLLFGNSWNNFLSMRVPVFKLIYSDETQRKKVSKDFNLDAPNMSEY